MRGGATRTITRLSDVFELDENRSFSRLDLYPNQELDPTNPLAPDNASVASAFTVSAYFNDAAGSLPKIKESAYQLDPGDVSVDTLRGDQPSNLETPLPRTPTPVKGQGGLNARVLLATPPRSSSAANYLCLDPDCIDGPSTPLAAKTNSRHLQLTRPRTANTLEAARDFTSTSHSRKCPGTLTVIKPTNIKRPKTADAHVGAQMGRSEGWSNKESSFLASGVVTPKRPQTSSDQPLTTLQYRQKFPLKLELQTSSSLLKNGISHKTLLSPAAGLASPVSRTPSPAGDRRRMHFTVNGLDFDGRRIPLALECYCIRLRIDQEGFREINPVMKFTRWDASLNKLEFKSDQAAFPFHSTGQSAPVLRKLLSGSGIEVGYDAGEEKDFLSTQAALGVKENGVWVVEGVESINKQKYTWSFAYEVNDRFSLMGKLMVNEKVGFSRGFCTSTDLVAELSAFGLLL
ncbi:hypothetical protein BT69DRAFT_1068737 [Atractiella rhizophila]|nr:hypothetical protein BT69DRAFT_1068737 [Atractiella rhizophila]